MLGPQLSFVGRTEVEVDSQRLAFFAGNDYHRLATEPAVLQALAEAAARYGMNAAGSRATTGNHALYSELEERLAEYLGVESAVVCSAGYLSSTMLLQSLAGSFGRILLDERAHGSLVDAALQSGLPMARYRSLDPQSLQDTLRSFVPDARPLVLTDGVFANSGAIPPLPAYVDLLEPYRGRVVVDEAHAAGAVGRHGQGAREETGVDPSMVFQTGTLSKAFGTFGGFVAGDRALAAAVKATRAFIGSTPAPLPVTAATLKSLEILVHDSERLVRLRIRALAVKQRLQALGFDVSDGPAPICSVTFGNDAQNDVLAEVLRAQGIYPPFINYPGCPPGGHFRFTLSSAHTQEQIKQLVAAAETAVGRLGSPLPL